MNRFCLLIVAVSVISCTSSIYNDNTFLKDGKYDSEFPDRNCSQQLEEISNTIRLINSIAFYVSYVMDDSSKFVLENIKSVNLEKTAVQQITFNRTASGTATIIYADQNKVAVLTVAHIVNFPDTIFSYFIKPDGYVTPYIESVSIKTKQTNYIPDFPSGGQLDILEIDEQNDLAILGKRFDSLSNLSLPVFNYKLGKSDELQWGTFVYVFGYPFNYKMISEGIVSPGRDPHSFLINTVFNRGSSGGIVLAIRDGVPNFELVGLVKSVPAEFEYNIRPMIKEHDLEFNPLLPYKGEVYAEKKQELRYGITKVIGAETIQEFINSRKSSLYNKGYFITTLTN
ncbi:serine protease [Melioribacteraceae bacterium 4301-Me]|uniref:S1 family peptidase n=1 Tax=Pyranulibacter aquaticus TaxID=3163344 RepID=UPI003599D3D8